MPPKIDLAALAIKAIIASPEKTSAILSKLSAIVLVKTLPQYVDNGRTLFAYLLDERQDITPFLTAVDRLRSALSAEILSQKIAGSPMTAEGLRPDGYYSLTPLMIAIRKKDTLTINALLASIKKLPEKNRFEVLSQVNHHNENAFMQLLEMKAEETALVLPNFLDLLQSLSKDHQLMLIENICKESKDNPYIPLADSIGSSGCAGTSLLSIATANQDAKNMAMLLSAIQKLPVQQQINILSYITPENGNNEIMVALEKAQLDIIDLFLKVIEQRKFPLHAKKSLLLHTNAKGENALMIAIRNGLTAQVKKILALISNATAEVLTQTTEAIGDTELLNEVRAPYFKEEHNWNALMLALNKDNGEIQNMVLTAMGKLPQKQMEKIFSDANPQGINAITLAIRNGTSKQIELIFSMIGVLTSMQQAKIFGKTDILDLAFDAHRQEVVGAILNSTQHWPVAAMIRFLSIKDIPSTVKGDTKPTPSTTSLLETMKIPESKGERALYGVQVEMALWLESLEYKMESYKNQSDAMNPNSYYQASRTLYETLQESFKHFLLNPSVAGKTLRTEWTDALITAAKSSLAEDRHWTEFLKAALLKVHGLLIRMGICHRATEPVLGKSRLGFFGRLMRSRTMEQLDGLHDMAVKLDEGRPGTSPM